MIVIARLRQEVAGARRQFVRRVLGVGGANSSVSPESTTKIASRRAGSVATIYFSHHSGKCDRFGENIRLSSYLANSLSRNQK